MRRIGKISISVVLNAAMFAAANAESPLQNCEADFELQGGTVIDVVAPHTAPGVIAAAVK